MSYTLGMVGPINVADYRDFLYPGQWRDGLPKGQGGTPVNLLCRELLRRGQSLRIFSCDSEVKKEVVLDGERLRICLGPKGKRPARDFFQMEREYLRTAIAREKPDIVHAQWTYEYAMPLQTMGIPHVISAHDAPLRCLRYNFIPYRIARTLMAYRVVSRAKQIVSVSPYVAQHLRQYLFYRGAMEVIPNGLPEQAFSVTRLPRSTDCPPTFACILVGWGAYKNGHVAIQAFASVRKLHPQARLILFGSGHGADEPAATWARERGLENGVEFVGQLPYSDLMARLVNEVDVLVHPSHEEAQSMAVIEAMARGIPVIAGMASGGVPWTLDNGRVGKLVDVRSPQSVSSAMLELIDDQTAWQRYAECGKAFAKDNYHIASVADAWQAVYDRVLTAG